MTLLLAVVLAAHGIIHLLGVAKAFGLAAVPQLRQPIPPFIGTFWLLASMLFLAAATALFVWPRGWWAIGACAVVVSTIVIACSWSDAKFGMLVNLIALVAVVFGFLAYGPASLRAAYEHDIDRWLARTAPLDVVTDADLTHLPEPVRAYLRASGILGRPRVRNFRARVHGRIRSGKDTAWLPIVAEQYNFIDDPARFFYLNGSMSMVPVQGYHRYADRSATMRIRAAALVPVVEVSGSEMTQSETVTLFNDMCLMAPAMLIDRAIAWQPVDRLTARATFTNAGYSIRAELSFNDAGELVDFSSDDRYQTSPDGSRLKKVRWSTPVGAYRPFGGVRLASRGEARWHEPNGEYAYIELTIDDVAYNLALR